MPRQGKQPLSAGNRIHAQELPSNASLAMRYARGTRATQTQIRRALMPRGDKAEFERWIVETQPWLFLARQDQLAPRGDWAIWLFMAGRGAGKTRAGCEWVWSRCQSHEKHRAAVISPTDGDLKRVTFDGESGLLRLVEKRPHLVRKVSKSPWGIEFTNGSLITSYTGEAYERLRGPQHHTALLDELAGMGRVAKDVYDQAMFGLRLKGPRGETPRMALTTTPKPLPIFKMLSDRAAAGDPGVVITRASMMDNEANLSPEMIREIRASYEGTRFGDQEIYGKLLIDVPGALWTHSSFAPCSMPDLAALDRIVVAVDPSGAADAKSSSDEIGIVVAGVIYGEDRGEDRFIVLQDATMIGSPNQWATVVCRAYEDFAADRVVAEANFGGGMVDHTIRSVNANVPVRMVTASRGKALRAEPVAALYERGQVAHVHGLDKLEAQMVQMTVTGYMGEASPDRVDALVWALTDLMDRKPKPIIAPTGPSGVSYWIPR